MRRGPLNELWRFLECLNKLEGDSSDEEDEKQIGLSLLDKLVQDMQPVLDRRRHPPSCLDVSSSTTISRSYISIFRSSTSSSIRGIVEHVVVVLVVLVVRMRKNQVHHLQHGLSRGG